MSGAINIAQAKARLSELVDRALEGEEIVIARRNKPLVRLVVVEPERKETRMGRFEGQVWMSDDFDDELEDFAEYM